MEIGGITVSEKIFDVAIIGGGGSGLRASLEISKSGLDVAVVSKVFPTRSHTVAAQGGITCAIASADPNDDWRDGTCLIQLKVLITLVTKMQLNICVPRVQMQFLN